MGFGAGGSGFGEAVVGGCWCGAQRPVGAIGVVGVDETFEEDL